MQYAFCTCPGFNTFKFFERSIKMWYYNLCKIFFLSFFRFYKAADGVQNGLYQRVTFNNCYYNFSHIFLRYNVYFQKNLANYYD